MNGLGLHLIAVLRFQASERNGAIERSVAGQEEAARPLDQTSA